MSESLIVEEITKVFPRTKRPALDKVSISLGDGEIMALVGESGSGKTTLLRIIAGLEQPDSGKVTIGGEIVFGSESKTLLPEERNIGFVFQDYALTLSVFRRLYRLLSPTTYKTHLAYPNIHPNKRFEL